jgi:fatty-acyl-CoA synthase
VTQPTEANSKTAREAWIRALERTAGIEKAGVTLPALIERLADRWGDAPALVSSEADLSYRTLSARANRYSRWGLHRGLRAGDTVCLMMANCAEYMAVWLGLSRIGATVALINNHLAGDALAHSINIVAPKGVIAGADLAARIAEVRARLPAHVFVRTQGGGATADGAAAGRAMAGGAAAGGAAAGAGALEPELEALSGERLADGEAPEVPLEATALYIYTSGTTGLPKAAKVSHYRVMQWSHWFAGLLDTTPADRMFNCLPLYHSVGGVVATGATLVGGGAVVIRARFSVSDFWRDVRDERCTLFQYIGELCRNLNNAPHQEIETGHSLRIACGNGLRPEVWEPFQRRFKIPRILEYYASTEGNFSLYNCEGQPGAIGKIPSFLAHRLPVALLRFDIERGEPRRNADGLCERCGPNEVGEAVGLIPGEGRELAGRFEGYADAEASARKVLRNVLKPGDAWYRTGDLMRRDEKGFYYFVDRVGETYRWKGENVSTAEVLTALTTVNGVLDGVVYGVSVPGTDGRAGMAALIVDGGFDVDQFRAAVAGRLPSYARPVFLRLIARIEATGTFKPRKQELVESGFDPARISDPLYFDDPAHGRYVRIDAGVHAALSSGAARV